MAIEREPVNIDWNPRILEWEKKGQLTTETQRQWAAAVHRIKELSAREKTQNMKSKPSAEYLSWVDSLPHVSAPHTDKKLETAPNIAPVEDLDAALGKTETTPAPSPVDASAAKDQPEVAKTSKTEQQLKKYIFAQIKGQPLAGEPNLIEKPSKIDINTKRTGVYEKITPYFSDFKVGDDGTFGPVKVETILKDMSQLQANERYNNAIADELGDPLMAACAAMASTPELQAKLYAKLAKAIVKIHKHDPSLVVRYIEAQKQADGDSSSYDWMCEQDSQKTDNRRKMVEYDPDGDISKPVTGQVWETRVAELKKVLKGKKEINSSRMAQIEFLSRSVNVEMLLELMKNPDADLDSLKFVPAPVQEAKVEDAVIEEALEEITEPSKEGLLAKFKRNFKASVDDVKETFGRLKGNVKAFWGKVKGLFTPRKHCAEDHLDIGTPVAVCTKEAPKQGGNCTVPPTPPVVPPVTPKASEYCPPRDNSCHRVVTAETAQRPVVIVQRRRLGRLPRFLMGLALLFGAGHILNQPQAQNNISYHGHTVVANDGTFPTRDPLMTRQVADSRESSVEGLEEYALYPYLIKDQLAANPELAKLNPNDPDPAIRAKFRQVYDAEFNKDVALNTRRIQALKDFTMATRGENSGAFRPFENPATGKTETLADHFDSKGDKQLGLHLGFDTPAIHAGTLNIGSMHLDPTNVGLLEHYRTVAPQNLAKFFSDAGLA